MYGPTGRTHLTAGSLSVARRTTFAILHLFCCLPSSPPEGKSVQDGTPQDPSGVLSGDFRRYHDCSRYIERYILFRWSLFPCVLTTRRSRHPKPHLLPSILPLYPPYNLRRPRPDSPRNQRRRPRDSHRFARDIARAPASFIHRRHDRRRHRRRRCSRPDSS